MKPIESAETLLGSLADTVWDPETAYGELGNMIYRARVWRAEKRDMERNQHSVSACGKDIGGIWVQHRTGCLEFTPLYCNKTGLHSQCAYLDQLSGNMVINAQAPTCTVSEKGSING